MSGRPLDVCLVSRVLWPGGSQRILIAEGEQLARRGHSVDLVFVRDTGIGSLTSAIPYRVLHGPRASRRHLGRFLQWMTARYGPERGPEATVDLDLLWRFERDRRHYDVVVYGDPWAAVFARGGARRHGDRYVVHVHETSFGVHDFHGHNYVPRLLEGRALRTAGSILTSSRTNSEALDRAGFSGVEVLYPGVAPSREVPAFEARENLAVSVTVWDPGRHPEVFLEIAAELDRGRILLVGQWTDAAALARFRNEIAARGLTERLGASGAVSEDALVDHYRRAKAAIRFGFGEAGPGMGSLEALGHGIPLIINPGVGVRELVVPGESCLQFPEHDAPAIAQGLARLFDDAAYWSRLSDGARAVAQSRSWASHGTQLERILRSDARVG
ncbi:MAG TPA: glycosyltransferase family 4 protein [Thermoplasmata archaeon]|nr:glycosyltransferase family 4 protein [Thermoplasmata archaeon]